MDWYKLENIASGKNVDGSEMYHRGKLSGIVGKINLGRKNIVEILSSVGSVLLWKELFTPEFVINHEYLNENPDVAEAINLSASNVDLEALEFDSQEEVMGFVNLTKGKLFELKVAEKLNNGERVGDFQLEPGQTVKLAESPIQEGYDLEIVNADGSIEEFYQCKATDSISLVRDALEENPEIPIIATSEVSESMGDADVLDSGILNEWLGFSLSDLLTEEFWSDVPGVAEALALIAIGREAIGVVKGEQTIKQGIKESTSYFLNRTVASVGGSVAAACAVAIGCGPIAVAGIGIASAVLVGRVFKKKKHILSNYLKRSFSPFTSMFNSFFKKTLDLKYRAILLTKYGLKNIEKTLKSPQLLTDLIKPFGFPDNVFTTAVGVGLGLAGAITVGKALISIVGTVGSSLLFDL